jgi:hypothetical protein
MNAELPIILSIKVESTNGTTCLMGVEHVAECLRRFTMPKAGEVIKGEFWKVSIIEQRNLLNETSP